MIPYRTSMAVQPMYHRRFSLRMLILVRWQTVGQLASSYTRCWLDDTRSMIQVRRWCLPKFAAAPTTFPIHWRNMPNVWYALSYESIPNNDWLLKMHLPIDGFGHNFQCGLDHHYQTIVSQWRPTPLETSVTAVSSATPTATAAIAVRSTIQIYQVLVQRQQRRPHQQP